VKDTAGQMKLRESMTTGPSRSAGGASAANSRHAMPMRKKFRMTPGASTP